MSWHLPLAANSAGFAVSVIVDPDGTGLGCSIERYSNDAVLNNGFFLGCWNEQGAMLPVPLDPDIARTVRFVRDNDQIAISLSSDGTNFEEVLRSDPLPAELRCAPQRMLISGQAWFNPSGAYAEYDYVELSQSVPE